MNSNDYELLQEGVGAVQGGGSGTHTVRIVPIGEGDITVGQSENRTYWDREALRSAVENGAFDGAKIVKGQGGEGHFSLNEQVPPERLLGRVDEWSYEEGVGPVGEAELLDEDLAAQIDMDLLDVSADMIRHLGAYDNDADAYNVDEIVAVPRITVLDRGASHSADIELASADVPVAAPRVGARGPATEQLAGALNVDDDHLREYLQDDITVSDPQYSGTTENSWDAPTLDGTYGGDMDAARRAALIHRGDAESFSDLSLFVVDGNGNLNLAALRAAKSRAPQTSGVSGDVLSRVQSKINRLANDEFDVDWDDEEQNAMATADGGTAAGATEYLQSAGDAVRWESSAGGEREPANYRYGVVVDELQDGPEDSVLVAVYQPTADYDGWENRNEQNPIQEDTLEVVGNDGVASLPPVSQVTEQNAPADGATGSGDGEGDDDGTAADADADEPPTPSDADASGDDGVPADPDDTALEALLKRVTRYVRGIVPSTGDPTLDDALENLSEEEATTTGWQPGDGAGYMPSEERGASTSDERAESRRDTRYTTYNTMPQNEPSPQEQLADARATIRTLEAELDEKDARIEELNGEIDEKESEIEQLEGDLEDAQEAEEELEALREQIQPWQETLAGIAAGESMLEAGTIAETHSFEQLSNTVLNQLDDGDDDQSPMDRLKEQLSDGVKTRGEATEETPSDPETAEENQARKEQLAESVMNVTDLRRANREELSSAEYVEQKHGITISPDDSEAEIRRKMASNSGGD